MGLLGHGISSSAATAVQQSYVREEEEQNLEDLNEAVFAVNVLLLLSSKSTIQHDVLFKWCCSGINGAHLLFPRCKPMKMARFLQRFAIFAPRQFGNSSARNDVASPPDNNVIGRNRR